MRPKKFLFALALGVTVDTHSQVLRTRDVPHTQEQLHQRVLAVYDFDPTKVSEQVRKEKSAAMDLFWSEMKAEPQITLPLLRTELQSSGPPAFFFTDGTELLLELSKSPEDKVLAAATLPRIDLAETQPGAYFFMAHSLACDGQDVTAGALHILDRADFRVPLPQHAMTLDRRTALMYVLLSMKDDRWVVAAGERLFREQNAEAKIALVFALAYAQTDDADALIRKVIGDAAQPEALRKKAQELLGENEKLAKSWMPIKGNIPEIRDQRRQRLRSVSDEAMDDVQWMTRKIAQLRAKGKS